MRIKQFGKTKDEFIVDGHFVFKFKQKGRRLYTKLIGYTTKGIIDEVKKFKRNNE